LGAAKKALGYTYTDISSELLKIWQLPEKIILPIRHFNEAKTIQINKDVKVLYLASRLALVDSHSDQFTYDESVDESLCKNLNISSEDLAQCVDIASQEAESILSIMNGGLFSK
jgi:HD-like signal output (HDOD) protein